MFKTKEETKLFEITYQDKNLLTDEIKNEVKLFFNSATITARDFISNRVRSEINNYNDGILSEEKLLIGNESKRRRANSTAKKVVQDADKKVAYALEAFEQNSFIVLVNEKQIESLDEEIRIDKQTVATFIKLIPLIGG